MKVLSCMHTGTHYICEVLGLDMETDAAHVRRPDALKLAKGHKVIVPLRHPDKVALSFRQRDWKARKGFDWLEQWQKLDEIEGAFFFPLETKPFDELEVFIGRPVSRIQQHISPTRKRSPNAVLTDEDRADVAIALGTEIGKRFY